MGWVMVLMPVTLLVMGVPIFLLLLATCITAVVFFTTLPHVTYLLQREGVPGKLARLKSGLRQRLDRVRTAKSQNRPLRPPVRKDLR